MRAVALAIAAFAAMEPVTAATHRFVMHGVGLTLHRSHHRRTHGGWERNDAYPVLFAALVCVALWFGFHDAQLGELIPVGVGVTAYGAAYAVVHDVYIHRRLRWFGGRRVAGLDRLAACHELHHRFGGPPYGMLVPVVPRRVRERAGTIRSGPGGERVAAVPGP